MNYKILKQLQNKNHKIIAFRIPKININQYLVNMINKVIRLLIFKVKIVIRNTNIIKIYKKIQNYHKIIYILQNLIYYPLKTVLEISLFPLEIILKIKIKIMVLLIIKKTYSVYTQYL